MSDEPLKIRDRRVIRISGKPSLIRERIRQLGAGSSHTRVSPLASSFLMYHLAQVKERNAPRRFPTVIPQNTPGSPKSSRIAKSATTGNADVADQSRSARIRFCGEVVCSNN